MVRHLSSILLLPVTIITLCLHGFCYNICNGFSSGGIITRSFNKMIHQGIYGSKLMQTQQISSLSRKSLLYNPNDNTNHRIGQQQRHRKDSLNLNMMIDPTLMDITESLSLVSSSSSNTLLLSFTDQGNNLAGIFFQASLVPYLLFLYFLSFRANRLNDTSQFGFQFVLLFVLATIPSGIISKSIYSDSLANTDYLHGGAETLLTIANILIVSFIWISLSFHIYLYFTDLFFMSMLSF